MPTNVEIKARVNNFERFRQAVEQISDMPCQIIPQEDVFFCAPHGRLKLRLLAKDRGQLIYYERPDSDAPKRSDYFIYSSANPAELRHVLERGLGLRGVVRKTRYLYMVKNTRIHLDQVEGLGDFMELEVVLGNNQTIEEGQAVALDLMTRLGICKEDLIHGAYMDLLEDKLRS